MWCDSAWNITCLTVNYIEEGSYSLVKQYGDLCVEIADGNTYSWKVCLTLNWSNVLGNTFAFTQVVLIRVNFTFIHVKSVTFNTLLMHPT